MNIQFLKLYGEGFLSYKNYFEIDFTKYNNKVVQIIGNNIDDPYTDSNGSGKSSIFEAISWGLFGRLSRSNKYTDEVINWDSNQVSITIEMLVDSTFYKITRTKNKNKSAKLSIEPNGSSLSDSTYSYIQGKLEEIIGLDYISFHNSILFSQGSKGFVSLKPMDRHTILTSVLDLDKYTKASKEAQRRVREIKELEYSKIEKKLRDVVSKKEAEESRSFEEDIKNFDKEKKKKIEELKLRKKVGINKINKELKNIEAEIEETNRQIAFVVAEIDTIEDNRDRINDFKAKLKGLYSEESTIKGDLRYKRRQLEDVKKHIELIKNESVCPLCKQKINKTRMLSKSTKLLKSIKDDIKEYEDAINNVVGFIEETERELEQLNEVANRKRMLVNKRKMLEDNIIDLERREKYLKKELARITGDYNRDIKTEKNRENIYLELEEQRKQNIKKYSAIETDLKKKLKQLDTKIKYFDFWHTNFKKLQLRLFNKIVEMFELFANDILSKHSSNLSVSFHTESETKSGTIRDGFEITVTTADGKSISFDMFSGGEKKRVSLAISIALSKIIQNQCGRDYGIILLDEPNDELDDTGKETNFKILEEIAKSGITVFVIDHDAYFKDKFDDVIQIEYKNGESVIKE